MFMSACKADHSGIKDKSLTTEETNPMLELQRSTARRMIGRNVQVACVDGQVVCGHIDWCSDDEIGVAASDCRRVIPLARVVGMVRRTA